MFVCSLFFFLFVCLCACDWLRVSFFFIFYFFFFFFSFLLRERVHRRISTTELIATRVAFFTRAMERSRVNFFEPPRSELIECHGRSLMIRDKFARIVV